jgi:hypothetical protein
MLSTHILRYRPLVVVVAMGRSVVRIARREGHTLAVGGIRFQGRIGALGCYHDCNCGRGMVPCQR